MKSFEADPDVLAVLDAADKRGIKLRHVCNESIRRAGPKIVGNGVERKQRRKVA